MSKKAGTTRGLTVGSVCRALGDIAPVGSAQSWDNVGLLAGDMDARARRVLLCIDLTPAVVDEAISSNVQFVMAYHPPIFKPITRLRVPSDGTDEAVFRCIRAGTAIYSMHTAFDAAEGGANDVIASMCGIEQTEPIEYAGGGEAVDRKIVVFVPEASVDAVAGAMFAAGAGRIGDYSQCSYRLGGEGTFLGGTTTNPAVGRRGMFETVDELRVEMVVSSAICPQ